MSKSVLVIDTPEKGCISCPIGQNDSNYRITRIYCTIAEETAFNEEAETVPDWCPLKPLPDKSTTENDMTDYQCGMIDGLNQCIDEITGGEVDD